MSPIVYSSLIIMPRDLRVAPATDTCMSRPPHSPTSLITGSSYYFPDYYEVFSILFAETGRAWPCTIGHHATSRQALTDPTSYGQAAT